MEVRIENLPLKRLACVRHVGPYHEIGAAFEKVFSLAGQASLLDDASTAVGIYHDDPGAMPPQELRSDACVVVTGPAERVNAVAGLTYLEGLDGTYAIATHRGTYSGLGDAWQRFAGEWFPGSGLQGRDGPYVEIYLNDMGRVCEEDLVTELAIPVL